MSQGDPAEHPGLGQLRAALVGRVCTGGTCQVTPESLGLYYRKSNENEATFVNLANADTSKLEALNKACQPATFGRGAEDVLDETYRKAGKMDLNSFAVAFDLSCSGIMDTVSSDLVKPYTGDAKTVKAELYKLNIYDKGSFFKAHKDTPHAKNMFASLVIVFPTPHEGGSLILRHKGQEQSFDSPSNKSEIGYIAFYSDVEHEVLPVTSGYRVTLTYNLYLGNSSNSENIKVFDTPCKAALQELLNDSSFLPEGGRLGFGLYHQYPYNVLFTSLEEITEVLKGSDATLYRVCEDLGLDVNLRILYTSPCGWDEILLPEFIDLSAHEQIENDIGVFLRDDFNGEVLKGSCYEGTPLPLWVTPKTTFNRVQENYVAYGNEATSAVLYGDLCLIVEIDSYASRN